MRKDSTDRTSIVSHDLIVCFYCCYVLSWCVNNLYVSIIIYLYLQLYVYIYISPMYMYCCCILLVLVSMLLCLSHGWVLIFNSIYIKIKKPCSHLAISIVAISIIGRLIWLYGWHSPPSKWGHHWFMILFSVRNCVSQIVICIPSKN